MTTPMHWEMDRSQVNARPREAYTDQKQQIEDCEQHKTTLPSSAQSHLKFETMYTIKLA